jgi:hypothetical protein
MDAGLAKIGKRELRELLTKGWMTHDAMWLMHTIENLGIETANKVNIASVRSMSMIEIKRLQKALGYIDINLTNFESLVEFMKEAFGLIKADFMQFKFDAPEKNVMSWEWIDGKCFAYEGVKALGYIDEYKCGIIERIEGWFSGLGISYRIEPKVDKCLMHFEGKCAGRFLLNLK